MQSDRQQDFSDSESPPKSYEPISQPPVYNTRDKRSKSFGRKNQETNNFPNAGFHRLVENTKVEKSTDAENDWVESPHNESVSTLAITTLPRKSSFKQSRRVPEGKVKLLTMPKCEESDKDAGALVVRAQKSDIIKSPVPKEQQESSIVVEDLDIMPRKRTVSFGICVQTPISEIQVRSRKITLPNQVRDTILKNLSNQKLDEFSKITMTIDLEKSECQTKGYASLKALDRKMSGGQSPTKSPTRSPKKFLPPIQDLEASEIIENSFDIMLNRSVVHDTSVVRRNRSNRPLPPLDLSANMDQDQDQDQDISIVVENVAGEAQEANQEASPEEHTEPIDEMDMERAEYEEKKKKLNEILKSLAIYKFRRALVVSSALLIASIFLLALLLGKINSYRPAFIVAYIFMTYYLIEHIIRIRIPDIIPWKKIENIFDAIDIAYLFFLLAGTDMRLSGIKVITKCIFFPSLITTIAYFCKSKAPKALRESQTAIRGLYTLQLLLMAGRVDGDLEWPWKAILSFAWLFFGLIGVYCALVGITVIVIIVLGRFKINIYKNVAKSTQILGFLWATLFSGLGVVVFIAMVGVVDTYDGSNPSNISIMHGALITQISLCSTVILYTLIFYKPVMDFLMRFNLDEYDYKEELGFKKSHDDLSRIVREKKDMYLVMLSSTYFLSLKNSFFMNKDKVQKMKKAIKQAKTEKFKSAFERKLDMARDELRKMGPITIQALRKEKEGLDEVFAGGKKIEVIIERESNVLEIENRRRGKSMYDRRVEDSPLRVERRKSSCHSIARNNNGGGKVCLSEGDRTYTLESPGMTPRGQEDNLCYICYEKPPNAVITACGHGGICVGCAIEAIKTNGQCMECRKQVDQVLRVHPDPKFKNIIKGYEMIKILPPRLARSMEAGIDLPR